MRRRQPEIPPRVAEAIRHFAPSIKRSIKAAIRIIGMNPRAGAPLQGELHGLWKYRVRRYRVIYRLQAGGSAVEIFAVGERRSIYEEVAELMRADK